MSLLTAEEVTNLYLYGDKTKPANIEDAPIRPIDDKKLINIDINEYMSGPGRFASPAFFDVIEQFFAPLDGVLLQLAFPASSNLAPGIYSKDDLFAAFGISKAWVGIQQSLYDDGQDNYLERAYIWESTAFQIDSRAKFVVEANGNRYIQDFAIIPYSANENTEDFDFKSDSGFSGLVNFALEPLVDPSGIGRTVVISFGETRNLQNTFTHADYTNAASTAVLPNPGLVGTIIANALSFTDQLFESGSIRFLDANNKPILYGSDQSDIIIGTLSRTDVDIAFITHPLSDWTQNGIRYIGGAGNDKLVGTDYDDKLFGGSGNDILEGGQGNDTLLGGQGLDSYIYHTGDGNDEITDEDGLGKLMVDSHSLVAWHTKDDSTNVFKTTGGDTLSLAGSTLTITFKGGDTITVLNFDRVTKNLGIDLKDESTAYNGSEINTLFLDALTKLAKGALDFIMPPVYAATNEVAYTSDNDLLIGRSVDDFDQILGGAGNDIIYADGPVDDLTAYLNADSGQSQAMEASSQNELLGQSGEDLLVGGATGDRMWGGSEADILIGGEGADQMVGDQSSRGDHLSDGSDEIYGGAGDDRQWGGGKGDEIHIDGFDLNGTNQNGALLCGQVKKHTIQNLPSLSLAG